MSNSLPNKAGYLFKSCSENMRRGEVSKLSKLSILFVIFFLFSTAYAFAAFLLKNIDPLPDPLNLLILGFSMIGVGHFLKTK